MLACEFAGMSIDLGGGDTSSEEEAESIGPPIEVGIDSPANGTTLQMGPVDIAYHASSLDGVSAVELSVDGQVVSSIASPESDQQVVALRYTWTPTAAGSHTLRVRAQMSSGGWSDYSSVNVNVEGGQPPPPEEPPAEEPEESPEPDEDEDEEPPDTDEVEIYNIKHNKDIFYYGSGGCSKELTISANIANPEDVHVAVLFIKFVDKEGEGETKWDGGRAMVKKSEGSYSVTLNSEKIPNYNVFEFTRMWYQIVAQDKQENYIARSEVIKEVTLEICQ